MYPLESFDIACLVVGLLLWGAALPRRLPGGLRAACVAVGTAGVFVGAQVLVVRTALYPVTFLMAAVGMGSVAAVVTLAPTSTGSIAPSKALLGVTLFLAYFCSGLVLPGYTAPRGPLVHRVPTSVVSRGSKATSADPIWIAEGERCSEDTHSKGSRRGHVQERYTRIEGTQNLWLRGFRCPPEHGVWGPVWRSRSRWLDQQLGRRVMVLVYEGSPEEAYAQLKIRRVVMALYGAFGVLLVVLLGLGRPDASVPPGPTETHGTKDVTKPPAK